MSHQICELLPHLSINSPRIAKSQITNLAMASTTATALGAKTGSCLPLTCNGSTLFVLTFRVSCDLAMLDGGLNATFRCKLEPVESPARAPSGLFPSHCGLFLSPPQESL